MVRELLRPRTIREAVRLKARPGAAYLGGGTWLNGLRAGAEERPAPEVLISLEHLGLDVVQRTGPVSRIGAAATFQRVIEGPGVPKAVRDALLLTASRTLRNMATIGGELGLRPADSALIPVLIALDAVVKVASRARPVPVEEHCRTASGDLVLEVSVRADRPCGVRAIARTSHAPRSLVVAVRAEGPRIVASDCRGQLFRFVELEEELAGGGAAAGRDRIEEAVRRVFFPTPDPFASAEYKRHLAAVMIADLLAGVPAAGEEMP